MLNDKGANDFHLMLERNSPVQSSLKYRLVFLFFAAITVLSACNVLRVSAVITAVDPRIARTINSDWTFNYFPQEEINAGVLQPDFKDIQWPAVALPHTWSTYETTGELHPFIRNASEKDNPYWWHGWGVYRKKFSIDPAMKKDKKLFIEFDGVMKNCQVWLNGKKLGEHKGGYNSFYFDISDEVFEDKENTLAVAVSNRRLDEYNVPPMNAGNFNLYGGIYRDVRIMAKDKLYIPYQGSYKHEGGTFITTPYVTDKEAVMQVKTWVKNDYPEPQSCKLVTTLADPQGKVVTRMESTALVATGQIYEFKQLSKSISDPKLWSVETPNVYTVYSDVYIGNKKADHFVSPAGFRYFHWNYQENQFYLNGKKIHIHGTNRHQEYPWLGDAIPKWLHEQDLRDIRFNLNHNFLRTAHYAQDKLVYQLTDKFGIIVCEEVPNIKSIDFSEEVQEQNVREMVRRDRNHPSILFWSVGNETNDAADSKWVHEEDTTRIIHARHVKGKSAGAFAPHTHEHIDMENLLRCTVRGWYNEDVKSFAPEDNQSTGHEEYQHKMARVAGGSQRGRIDMNNGVMWIYADHGADREYKNNPLKHLNPKGWVDAYRIPKYLYYLWQANYAAEPMAFIHPHFWREQYIGLKKDFIVDSNCDSIELKVNGKSYGVLKPSADNFFTVTFKNVPVEKAEMVAEGTRNGKKIRHSLVMAGKPFRLALSASHKKIQAGLDAVAIVTADIVDENGVHVYGATNPLTWEVEGPATLVGPAKYTSDIDKYEVMDGTMYIDAPVSNVIRSNGKPGLIKVRVLSDGLLAGTIEIAAESTETRVENGIIETSLPETVRVPVSRNTGNISQENLAPAYMKIAERDVFIKAKNKQAIRQEIEKIILGQNPKMDTSAVEFEVLADQFVYHLQQNHGELVADDYNFSVNKYNIARNINQFLSSLSLPKLYINTLQEYFADLVIRKGTEPDFGKIKERFATMQGTGVLVRVGSLLESDKDWGVRLATSVRLGNIVSALYPEYQSLSNEAQKKVLEYIRSVNPHIQVKVEELAKGELVFIREINKAFLNKLK